MVEMTGEIPVIVEFVAPTTNLTLDYTHKTSENQKDFQKLDTLGTLEKEGTVLPIKTTVL